MTLAEALQWVNLLLVPVLVYVIKLERRAAGFDEWRRATEEIIRGLHRDQMAVHRRLDRLHIPAASADA